MTRPNLPPQIKVLVRDWLNANNILLRSENSNALIDSGYCTHAGQTLALLRSPDALGTQRIDWLINTHCHSDHMGGNAVIQREYGCRTSIPAGEAPLVSAWDTRGLWLDYADQRAERFSFDDTIAPGDTLELGDLTWRAIAAPGHDMGALVFHCPEERLLISGDALWENGFGVVIPDRENVCLAAARDTLETIASLDIATVIPGHGKPFSNISEALERSFKRVEAFEADASRMARHVLKVMLVFALLDRQRLQLAELPGYVGKVPVYVEYNEMFFQLKPGDLAELLVGELERAKVVTRREGCLVPAAA